MNKKKVMELVLATMVLAACIAPREAFPVQVIQYSRLFVSNYPNPFDSRSGSTTIVYTLSRDAEVQVKIYDLLGNVVKEYPVTFRGRGQNSLEWDGTNASGEKVAKGGYLAVVQVIDETNRLVSMRKIGVIH